MPLYAELDHVFQVVEGTQRRLDLKVILAQGHEIIHQSNTYRFVRIGSKRIKNNSQEPRFNSFRKCRQTLVSYHRN